MYLVVINFCDDSVPRSFVGDTLTRVFHSSLLCLTLPNYHKSYLKSIHLMSFEGRNLYDPLLESYLFETFDSFRIHVNSSLYE